MTTPLILASFAGGEFSPALYARVDLAKYQVGAALIQNFTVDVTGGVSARGGTRFIAPVKDQAARAPRMIPFIVSDDVSYWIELGDGYARFYQNGSPLVKATKSIASVTQANPGVFTVTAHGYATGDWLRLANVAGMPQIEGIDAIITVLTADTFTAVNAANGIVIDTTGAQHGPYTGGGTVAKWYEIHTPWDADEVWELKYAQSVDVLTLTHPNFPPYDLARQTASKFNLTPFSPGPKVATPTNLTGTANTDGDTPNLTFGYVVTALDENGKEESLPSNVFTLDNAYLREFDGNPRMNNLTWTATPLASGYNIYKWGGIIIGEPDLTVFGFIGQATAPNFTDNNIGADISKQPPEFRNPFATGGGVILGIEILTPGAGYLEASTTITITGAGIGATATVIVEEITGMVLAVFLVNGGINYTDPGTTVTIGGVGAGATAAITGVSAGDVNYPSVVSYYQQRKVYAASETLPEGLWMSQIGLYDNFDVSPAVADNEAVSFSLASLNVNAIRALVPTNQGLIGFTSSNVWIISGETAQKAITPTAVSALPQEIPGISARLPPISVNASIMYVQSMGYLVRDVTFDINSFGYKGANRSELAVHLFEGYTINDWCWSEEPDHILWTVRDDGYMLSMTYVPEQEVFGWTRHTTQGRFLACVSTPEPPVNAVYVVVERVVDGTYRKYIERFADRDWGGDVERAWCVDSGLQNALTFPAATIQIAKATGNNDIGVVATSGTPFVSGDVGKVIRALGGRATVTDYLSSTAIRVSIDHDFSTIPETDVVPLLVAGEWSMTAPVDTVYGASHLAGERIDVLGDGNVYQRILVSADGGFRLPLPCTLITAGLGYTKNLQTLYIPDLKTQTKLKLIPIVSLRVQDFRGFQVGPDFQHLADIDQPFGLPVPLHTSPDDLRTPTFNNWTRPGQICVQSTLPLPGTILGLIPQVELGGN